MSTFPVVMNTTQNINMYFPLVSHGMPLTTDLQTTIKPWAQM
jgi:hypothetical protein